VSAFTLRFILAVSVVIAAIADPAHATQYTCRPEPGSGASDKVPAYNKIILDHVGKSWRITHFLSNGQIEDITDQYRVLDASLPGDMARSDGTEAWKGRARANPNLSMAGMMMPFNGELTYTEQRNTSLPAIVYLCAVTSQPAVAVAAPAPAPVVDSVPITTDGTHANVDIMIGEFDYHHFLIDTGADIMSVNPDVAASLIAGGYAVEHGAVSVKLADGSVSNERRILIDQIRIGRHTITNVAAAVNANNDGMNLLPFQVLNQMGKFTIDTANEKLIFGRSAPSLDVAAIPARASDECNYLHARLLERDAAAKQAGASFMQFVQSYGGTEVIARNPRLWAQAQMLDQRANTAIAAQLATSQAMLADHCVASGDLPRFRNWVATMQSVEAIQTGGLTP
jgi:Aspartyl protease